MNRQTNVRDMILIAMFAALTAVGAFIKIPTPIVPFTLQFLFCAYAGIFLGGRKGFISMILYVGIGLVGIPIFTKGGGPQYIFQPTFGYLIGFILCATIIGYATQNLEKLTFIKTFSAVLAGLAVVYLVGVPYMYMILTTYLGKDITFGNAVAWGFTPFILTDVIISFFVAVTAVRIMPILKRAGYIN